MGKKTVPLKIVFHFPSSRQGKAELKCRVSEINAEKFTRCFAKMNCTSAEKVKIIDKLLE